MQSAHRKLVVIAAAALCIAGCGREFGVKRVSQEQWTRAAHVSAVSHDDLSPETARLLRRYDLGERFARRPQEAIENLVARLLETHDRNMAVALSEMCYAHGKRLKKRSPEATSAFLSSGLLAYAFLFDPGLEPQPSSYDKRFRDACELYDHALSNWAYNTRKGGQKWGDAIRVPTAIGEVHFEWGRNDLSWGAPFTTIEPVYSYEVRGLTNRMNRSGLGVPLIAIRQAPPKNERSPQDRFLPATTTQAFPATLVLRLTGSLADASSNGAPLRVIAEAYDPLDTTAITIDGQTVPLEADTTAPFAYTINYAPMPQPVKWLMNPAEIEDRRGLYMLQPYKKGKIPVVFVHGLLSSPMTWLDMINDVLGAEGIRDKYQVWFFLYPTGNPPLYSAYLLRHALKDAKATFDPEDQDPAFDDMVIIGHSMGGLITHINATNIGDKLWTAMFATPFNDVNIAPKTREFLRELFYVEPLPFVTRVIFIATPHRGSGLADAVISKLFAGMVKMPDELAEVLAEREQLGSKVEIPRNVGSIAGLSEHNPILAALNEMDISTRVRYHSIIANNEAAEPGGTDTIVPYESAYIKGAKSELNIKGTHTCTRHPDAIREVRRILLLHARELEGN